jgi:uncharacterized membrane protein YfcA
LNQSIFFTAMATAAFITGLSKGGLGGGLGFLITPLLALVIPLDQAIGLMLPVLIFADVFALAAHWRGWERGLVGLLLVGGVIGVSLATFFIKNISVEVLQKVLGGIALGFVVIRLIERWFIGTLNRGANRWVGVFAGTAAGFTSTLAHAGGPPITIFLLMQNMEPTQFVATLILYFAVLNWIKVPYYLSVGLLNISMIFKLIWVTPFVPMGVWIGKRLVNRIDRVIFERIVYVLLALSGTLLLLGL